MAAADGGRGARPRRGILEAVQRAIDGGAGTACHLGDDAGTTPLVEQKQDPGAERLDATAGLAEESHHPSSLPSVEPKAYGHRGGSPGLEWCLATSLVAQWVPLLEIFAAPGRRSILWTRVSVKRIQVIDAGRNCTYGLFAASEKDFVALFPGERLAWRSPTRNPRAARGQACGRHPRKALGAPSQRSRSRNPRNAVLRPRLQEEAVSDPPRGWHRRTVLQRSTAQAPGDLIQVQCRLFSACVS